jgi:hypothetical protein
MCVFPASASSSLWGWWFFILRWTAQDMGAVLQLCVHCWLHLVKWLPGRMLKFWSRVCGHGHGSTNSRGRACFNGVSHGAPSMLRTGYWMLYPGCNLIVYLPDFMKGFASQSKKTFGNKLQNHKQTFWVMCILRQTSSRELCPVTVLV